MRILPAILCVLGLSLIVDGIFDMYAVNYAADSYIRNQVVLLKGNNGSCTGVKVKVNSNFYILTAAHCKILLKGNAVQVEEENGNKIIAKLAKISEDTDLMLLSADIKSGIKVAIRTYKHEKVHSLTHVLGLPTHRTDGELLKEDFVSYGMYIIMNKQSEDQCKAENNEIEKSGLFEVCIKRLYLMYTTVSVMPGSSGGPVVNEAGELVGIVSGKHEEVTLSYITTLKAIKDILN